MEQEHSQQEYSPEEILEMWKNHYGEINAAEVNGETFIYRLISRKEYNEFKDLAEDSFELEEMVCTACILEPIVDWTDDIFAGYTSSLSVDILENSYIIRDKDNPFSLEDVIEHTFNEVSSSLDIQMVLVIKHCFPEYRLEEIELMPLPKQFDLFSKGRWMLEHLEGNPLDLKKEEM